MPSHDKLGPRNSYMALGRIYFWTATINSWQRLLEPDPFKDEIIGSLATLSQRGMIDVFGFVIMPNHMHLIWRANALNGKETPQGSLLKFTAHQFKKMLIIEGGQDALKAYSVQANNKSFEFWQRDPLAIPLINLPMAVQKLTYTHNNPLADRWCLADSAESYRYSSARFYTTGIDDFGFLKNLYDAFPMTGNLHFVS